jgi:ligand-binding sensor domain-containing protein
MKKLILLFIVVIINSLSFAQNPEWLVYDTVNSGLPDYGVKSITIDEYNTKWIGTLEGGLAEFDGTNWTVYNYDNTGFFLSPSVNSIAIDENDTKWIGIGAFLGPGVIPGNLLEFDGTNWTGYISPPGYPVYSVAIDENNTKWIGTYEEGIAEIDGSNWTFYNSSNSGLPHDKVNTIARDENDTKWIGTDEGLAEFDGTNWTIYNSSNSGLPHDKVNTIARDENDTKWIGTVSALAEFDGTNWTIYNPSNSGLPGDWVTSIAIDENGTKWIGTYSDGLAAFDGNNWTIYNTSNSELPDNAIMSLAVDVNGTKWIGTYVGGLAAFNENGIPVNINEIQNIKNTLFIYPNPTSDMINIGTKTHSKIKHIEILNIHGQVVKFEIIECSFKSIDIGGLPNGLYTIQAQNECGVTVNKFIKN